MFFYDEGCYFMRHLKNEYGHWLFHNAYPALFWAGLVVNLAMVVDEETLEKYSCEAESHHYLKDLAKQIFWLVFLSRLIVIPLLAQRAKKQLSEKALSFVSLYEAEIGDGTETALFVSETVKKTKAPKGIAFIFIVPAIWPIFCCIYKHCEPKLSRGEASAYHVFRYTPSKRKLFIFMEALYNALSLGSATSFLTSLLFNIFYNCVHDDTYVYEDQVTATFVALGAVIGLASVFTEKLYKTMCYAEVFITTLYYSFDIIISSIDCTHPEYFTKEGFEETGWKYVLVCSILSLGVSVIGGFHGLEDLYNIKDEEDDEEMPLIGLKPYTGRH
jgi:hypothetical protein